MRFRRLALGTALGTLFALAPLSPALAQEGQQQEEEEKQQQLRIVEPPNQSEAVEGETFPVQGTGCMPGETVTIKGWPGTGTTTTADDEGNFETSITMPEIDIPDGLPPDVGEFSLEVSCGDQEARVLMIAVDRDYQDEVVIAEPASRSTITEGETFTVRGSGCPWAPVRIEGYGESGVETDADQRGRFEASLTMPEVDFPPGTPAEDREFVLRVTCGNEDAEVVLIAEDRDSGGPVDEGTADDGDQVEVVPEGGVQTGPGADPSSGSSAGLLGLGALLVVAGAIVPAAHRLFTRRRIT